MDVFSLQSEVYEKTKVEEITLQDYLLACREDAGMRATAAERMIAAIGEPELVDTSQDQRLSRIFLNRTIKRYPAFADLYGMEEIAVRFCCVSIFDVCVCVHHRVPCGCVHRCTGNGSRKTCS